MPVSLAYLQQCAAETGYSVSTLEKVTRLGELAAAIARHPLLGASLALKGGTALNLCFGSPMRMSVDLDYNYIASADREQMLADRPRIEEAVEDLAERLGLRVQRSADMFAGRKLYAEYQSVLGPSDRVEVDLNFLWRVPLGGVSAREMWQPGDLDRPSPRLVSLEELCVGKLLALLDRAAPRDAWDAGRLPQIAGSTLKSPLFRGLFIGMSAILDHPIHSYSRKRIENLISPRLIEEQLFPMLATSDRPDAHTLVTSAWDVVEPFVNLNEHEARFIAAVDEGRLEVGTLFPENSTLVNLINTHPAIRWKMQNVRTHRK